MIQRIKDKLISWIVRLVNLIKENKKTSAGIFALFIFACCLFIFDSSTTEMPKQIKPLPKMSDGILAPSSWARSEKTVEYRLNGPNGYSISPENVYLKKGQIISIWISDGEIVKKSSHRADAKDVSPEKIIRFTFPGETKRHTLNSDFVTEFQVKKSGQLNFSANVSGDEFSGRKTKKQLKIGPLRLKVAFLKKSSGKGGMPVVEKKIEKFNTTVKKKLKEITVDPLGYLGKQKKAATEIPKAAEKTVNAFHEKAKMYWKKEKDNDVEVNGVPERIGEVVKNTDTYLREKEQAVAGYLLPLDPVSNENEMGIKTTFKSLKKEWLGRKL